MVICGDESYQLNNPLKRNHAFGTRFLLGSLQHNVFDRNCLILVLRVHPHGEKNIQLHHDCNLVHGFEIMFDMGIGCCACGCGILLWHRKAP